MCERRRTIAGTIRRALLVLPAAGLLAAGTMLSPGASHANTETCHPWHVSNQNSQLIAAGDLYRICDDRLEVLIVEDEHNTLATYPIS